MCVGARVIFGAGNGVYVPMLDSIPLCVWLGGIVDACVYVKVCVRVCVEGFVPGAHAQATVFSLSLSPLTR